MTRASTRGRKSKPQVSGDVDAYLESLPADARAALQKLRKAIGAAAPNPAWGGPAEPCPH
jgi:hypothetical protein